MFLLFVLTIGSALIGYGTSSWSIGFGVLFITVGFHLHSMTALHSMHASLVNNLRQIYNKIG